MPFLLRAGTHLVEYDDRERKWHDLQQEELDRKLQWLNEAPASEPSAAGQPGLFGQGKKRLQELVRAARPPSYLLYCLGTLCGRKQSIDKESAHCTPDCSCRYPSEAALQE